MKRLVTHRHTGLFGSFALVALAGLLGLSMPSDRVIETQFTKVMGPSDMTAAQFQMPAAVSVAGSEDYWLKHAELEAKARGAELEHVVWSKPLGVGDTFTVGRGADRKELQVIAVKEQAPTVTRLEVGTLTGKQLWIQARDAALGTLHTVRLDVEPTLPL
jgi:hypothetical protein